MRKAFKAARTEAELEQERLRAALGDDLLELQSRARETGQLRHLAVQGEPVPAQPASGPQLLVHNEDAFTGADVLHAKSEHLEAIRAALAERTAADGTARVRVLWARSAAAHVSWCERRIPEQGAGEARDVLCVARVEGGHIAARWTFG